MGEMIWQKISRLNKPAYKVYAFSLFRHYKPKAIAMYVYYLHTAVVFQVLAQFCNVHVHTTPVKIGITTPYAFKGRLARKQVVFVFAQHQQQFIFLWRQRMRFTIML